MDQKTSLNKQYTWVPRRVMEEFPNVYDGGRRLWFYRIHQAEEGVSSIYMSVIGHGGFRADFWDGKTSSSVELHFPGEVMITIGSDGKMWLGDYMGPTGRDLTLTAIKELGLIAILGDLKTLPEQFHERLKPVLDLASQAEACSA
ncbi:hypothetical protein J4426_01450 [Candidatus Woesearchaeota archaeon]|nr:hypothetical protein [Candidatus Woesearchaeota archaeon]